MISEQQQIIERALTDYSKKLSNLADDSSLETTNEFFRNDLRTNSRQLGEIRDKVVDPTSKEIEIKGVISHYKNSIMVVLEWYVNDLKQSKGIAKHRLSGFVPEFKTLDDEITLVEQTRQNLSRL